MPCISTYCFVSLPSTLPRRARKLFAHFWPFQAHELNQTAFRIVLDMEQHKLDKNELDFDALPLKIDRARRDKKAICEAEAFSS